MKRRLTIEWKILAGMGILILGYLCSVGYNFVQEAGSEVALREISRRDFPQAMESGQATFAFETVVKLYQDATTLGEKSLRDEARERATATVSLLKLMAERSGSDTEMGQRLVERSHQIAAYAASADNVYESMNGGEAVDFEALQARATELSQLSETIKSGLIADGDRFEDHLETALSEVESATRFRRWMNVWICLAVVAISGTAVAIVIRRAVTRPINDIVKRLSAASRSVTSGSYSISRIQQDLAEESSRQASTLDEFSSSLEEITSMTQSNADNAVKASDVMQITAVRVKDASTAIKQLKSSMAEISEASAETQKIVKTIDEIAFQTNILALNAAVEAARAGEAGAGFAVVADEVRSLAQRAAESARNTASLIDGSAEKIAQGSETAEATNDVFLALEQGYDEIRTLINSISQASGEQAEGLRHINDGVSSMDATVRYGAERTQQSASSAKEMSRQAREMDRIVEDLVRLVGHGNETEPSRGGQPSDAAFDIDRATGETSRAGSVGSGANASISSREGRGSGFDRRSLKQSKLHMIR